MVGATRAQDERLLRWIAARRRGVSAHAIAQAEGLSGSRVMGATNALRDADAAESGEDVRGAYW